MKKYLFIALLAIFSFSFVGVFYPSSNLISSAFAAEATPTTHPDQFESVRNTPAKRHKSSGEIWEHDRLHRNHWEVYKNRKNYDNGKRHRAVWDDGRLKETF